MEYKYILSLNGSFLNSYNLKDVALNDLNKAYDSLSDEEKKYSSITLDEIENSLFREYLMMGKDDDFLRDNSKLIKEL